MKTISPNISIAEVNTQSFNPALTVDNFRTQELPAFTSDLAADNFERMTGMPSSEMPAPTLLLGEIDGELVSVQVVVNDFQLTQDQMKDLLKLIYSSRYEQITERFDEALKTNVLNILDPADAARSKVLIGYNFAVGCIQSIYITWK